MIERDIDLVPFWKPLIVVSLDLGRNSVPPHPIERIMPFHLPSGPKFQPDHVVPSVPVALFRPTDLAAYLTPRVQPENNL